MVVNPRLKTYLKLAYAGPGEKQQILNRIPRNLSAYDNEGQIVSVRELLTTTDVAGTSLIQTEMYNTVMEGAKKSPLYAKRGPQHTDELLVAQSPDP